MRWARLINSQHFLPKAYSSSTIFIKPKGLWNPRPTRGSGDGRECSLDEVVRKCSHGLGVNREIREGMKKGREKGPVSPF